MSCRIFISYRRDDSIGTSGRLYDRMVQTFGRGNVFMDVDHIPAGVDFVRHLNSQVAACNVFLAVIGPDWLSTADAAGNRRLDNPNDFVRLELQAALARDVRVIPVLVDGARMPKPEELPEPLQPLSHRQAVELRNVQFGSDADRLIGKIGGARAGRWPRLPVPVSWPIAAAGLAALLLAIGLALFWSRTRPTYPIAVMNKRPADISFLAFAHCKDATFGRNRLGKNEFISARGNKTLDMYDGIKDCCRKIRVEFTNKRALETTSFDACRDEKWEVNDYAFKVTNHRSVPIRQLFFSQCESSTWGVNRLGAAEVIGANGKVFDMYDGVRSCCRQIKAEFTNGQAIETKLEVCNASEWVVPDYSITVSNKRPVDIVALRFALCDAPSYGEDRLGSDEVIRPGWSRPFDMYDGNPSCCRNVQAQFRSGPQVSKRIDACRESKWEP